MKLRLNDGESVVVTARGTDKAFCIICRDNWIGLREFKNTEQDSKKESANL